MTTYVLTVTSKSGRPLNITKTEPVDSIAVYSKKDLDLRAEWREEAS